MKIYLSARDAEALQAWRLHCGHHDFVIPAMQAIENINAEAIVAPGNSFGNMTGGIDLHYKNFIGDYVEEDVQHEIYLKGNELLVGDTVVVILHSDNRFKFTHLIYAPTMRVPENVSHTINAYMAAKAALQTAEAIGVNSIVFPGLGTGTGGMDMNDCAKQVNAAIEDVLITKYAYSKRKVYIEQDHMRKNIVSAKWYAVQNMETDI